MRWKKECLIGIRLYIIHDTLFISGFNCYRQIKGYCDKKMCEEVCLYYTLDFFTVNFLLCFIRPIEY